MFDDARWKEDDYDDDDGASKPPAQEMIEYLRRRDRQFEQAFGRFSEFQDMQPFDVACIMTDWKDLSRPTTTTTLTSADLVQMVRETAVTVCPCVAPATYEEVYG